MRCKGCQYPLWNLPARTCPECGRGFAPSEFEFAPDTVRFCCPHCRQEYYGTDQAGHLVPRAFNCVKCDAPIEMDQMLLLPAAGTAEDLTRPDEVPWTSRHQGWVGGWGRTLGRGMFLPVRLGRLIPAEGGWAAVGFAMVTALLQSALFIGTIAVPVLIMAAYGMMRGGRGGGASGLAMGAGFVGFAVGWVAAIGVILALWGLVAHVVLMLTGKVEGGLSRTYAAIGYGAGAVIVAGVPCVGMYLVPVALIWWTVSSAIMIAVSQRVSGVRAAIAASSLPAVLVLGMVAWVGWLFMAVIPAATARSAVAIQAAASAQAMNKTANVASALIEAAEAGTPARHAAELVLWRKIFSADFHFGGTPTDPEAGFVGGRELDLATMLRPDEQQQMVELAVAAVGTDGVHRVGDMVVCAKGVFETERSGSRKDLWIVIFCPVTTPASPAAAPAPSAPAPGTMTWVPPPMALPTGVWVVGKGDGTSEEIPAGQTAERLEEQNSLRRSLGLPEIPDPASVKQVTGLEEEGEGGGGG